MAKIPDCKWAQRKDKLFLTINVANLDKDVSMLNPFHTLSLQTYFTAGDFCMVLTCDTAPRTASRRRPSM